MEPLLRSLACLTLLISSISPASAILVSQDDPTHGPDSITRDTDTGLDWLDLTLTTDRSYNDVMSNFTIGGDFAGFRFATGPELSTLFYTSAGITPGFQTPREPAAENLQDLIGITIAQFGRERTIGFFDTTGLVRADLNWSEIHVSIGSGSNSWSRADVGNAAEPNLNSASPNIGSYLVRAAVPEPTSFLFFSFLTIGIIGVKRIRPRQCPRDLDGGYSMPD
ncbi:MAG: hypothetical protein AAGD11_08935 [Planctomycetota bacterium]